MFRKLTIFAMATLIATPAFACAMTGKDELFMNLIRIGERSYHEPVPLAAPDIAYTDETGARKSLKDHTGKSMIVTFWHPDCAGCKVDLPRLNTFLEQNPDMDRSQFLQISIEELNEGPYNQDVDVNDVRSFLQTKSFGAIDGHVDMGNEIFNANCLVATPSHLMINRDGKITDVLFGPLRWSESPFVDIAKNYLANY